MKRTVVIWLILLLAFCGLADSAYLAQHEADGTPLICDITSLSGCNVVAASPYSHVFGVPLAEYGLVFYGLIFLLAAVELVFTHVRIRRALQGLAAVGLIASAYFVFVQISVINALCIYCTASAVISLLVFVCAYFIEPLSRGAIPLSAPTTRSPLVLPPTLS